MIGQIPHSHELIAERIQYGLINQQERVRLYQEATGVQSLQRLKGKDFMPLTPWKDTPF